MGAGVFIVVVSILSILLVTINVFSIMVRLRGDTLGGDSIGASTSTKGVRSGCGGVGTRGRTVLGRVRSVGERGSRLGGRVRGRGGLLSSIGGRGLVITRTDLTDRGSPRSAATPDDGIYCLAFSSNPSRGALRVLGALSRCGTGTAFFIIKANGLRCLARVTRGNRAVKLRDGARRVCDSNDGGVCDDVSTCFGSLGALSSGIFRGYNVHSGIVHFPNNNDGAADGGMYRNVVAHLAGRIRVGNCNCFS